ncbi:hypothetical protein [Streptomyces poonensis]|uniref:Uncharacterized protein n=1 Tax=Streptomyces poonensis TaxID=68255 RepID=A0A918UHN2_9ACTN|nr:hypothetical protein [Streptomyces poonensis]GGZ10119.1 hypothetical protein GCM10010365_31650 [Streptomyces poonensis]GLJ91328.1 hypothetical protein GCM10017589_39350 [Streptomyces poonensis]
MFEIRVICDPADADRITTALGTAFATGTVRQYPTRDADRHRLYVSADHRPAPAPWPTPDEAYALAPSIVSEIGWTARTLAAAGCFTELDRDFYLRKAAVLDRIALLDEPGDHHGDATEAAVAAALYLLDRDQAQTGNPVSGSAAGYARGYVRQQYAHWAKNQ